MILNPIRLIRRRRRFKQAVEDEVRFLRRAHGDQAHAAAVARINRPGLTEWGRRVSRAAAEQLRPGARQPSSKGGLAGILTPARR